MIAIVTNFGDFDVAITFEEFDNWRKETPIEGELLGEGEVPCGKRIKIILEPMAEKLVDYHLDGDDWDHANTAELICNQTTFERLDKWGKLYTEIGTINILIQISNALGHYHD